jgi:threonine synthase
MKYYSLNKIAPKVGFRQAVINGLAPDKGLYFPESITPLPDEFFSNIGNLTNVQIAYAAIRQFVGQEIPDTELRQIIDETLSFDFPLIEIESDVFSLELYHGPTMAFKDVGARFMARCLAYFNKENTSQKNTVLVATSGDTGGAVANGFLGVDGVNVVILYPSGKVSDIQERQLTTLGQNISALEVDGTFDDCQDMVKKAFTDESLKGKNLTSANSINIARWLPQMFYFFFAYKALKTTDKPLMVSCPSGNFGNICAGILAKRLGLPISHFVAATNSNDTVRRFLESWSYEPKTTKPTLSNAMDVSNPSNFVRIRELYHDDKAAFEKDFSSYSFSDDDTRAVMQHIFMRTAYMLEPHGAVGYLGLKAEMEKRPGGVGVFLETAHPVKFLESVDNILGAMPGIPPQISEIMHKEKRSRKISTYDELKEYLLQSS